MNRLTGNERLTLSLSAAALLVSLVSLYFQSFYNKQEVDGVLVNADLIDGELLIQSAIVNSGNRSVLVVSATAVMFEEDHESHLSPNISFIGRADIRELPMVIEPGKLVLLDARVSSQILESLRKSVYRKPRAAASGLQGARVGLSFTLVDSRGDKYATEPLLFTLFRDKNGWERAVFDFDKVDLLNTKKRLSGSVKVIPKGDLW